MGCRIFKSIRLFREPHLKMVAAATMVCDWCVCGDGSRDIFANFYKFLQLPAAKNTGNYHRFSLWFKFLLKLRMPLHFNLKKFWSIILLMNWYASVQSLRKIVNWYMCLIHIKEITNGTFSVIFGHHPPFLNSQKCLQAHTCQRIYSVVIFSVPFGRTICKTKRLAQVFITGHAKTERKNRKCSWQLIPAMVSPRKA